MVYNMYQMIHFLEVIGLNQEITLESFFTKTFLFTGISEQETKKILSGIDFRISEYKRGDTVYSQEVFYSKIGFILEGACSVCQKKAGGRAVPLNVLEKYQSFGISAVLSLEDSFPTEITAKKETKIIFISRDDFINAIHENGLVAMNVINFLAGRIKFLNKKIATFSLDGCEQRLSRVILAEYERLGESEFSLNCKKTAEELNIGRASLYRSIKELCSAGYIEYENKKIIIKDPIGLKGISK